MPTKVHWDAKGLDTHGFQLFDKTKKQTKNQTENGGDYLEMQEVTRC